MHVWGIFDDAPNSHLADSDFQRRHPQCRDKGPKPRPGGVGGSPLGAPGGLQSLGQIGNIGASGVVGALLPIIIGILKNKFAKV